MTTQVATATYNAVGENAHNEILRTLFGARLVMAEQTYLKGLHDYSQGLQESTIEQTRDNLDEAKRVVLNSKMMTLMLSRNADMIDARIRFVRRSMVWAAVIAAVWRSGMGATMRVTLLSLLSLCYAAYSIMAMRNMRERRYDDYKSIYFSPASGSAIPSTVASDEAKRTDASCE